MVHPDVYNETHSHWKEIISDEVDLWRQDIANNVDNFLRKNRNSFLSAYKDLSKACKINRNKLIDFNILYERYVPGIINTLAITKVNRHSNNINWENAHNILIGGYMLDRGYVVQGLVTTYMPRGKGGGMVDSLQQRGRFYGYKRDHLGFIKSWMTRETIDAYKSYAKHETDLYSSLRNLSQAGKPLREWERMMLLDKGLIPCRKNVMGIGLKNDYTWGGGWYWPSHPIAGSMDNRDLFRAIIEAYKSEFKPLTLKGFDSSKWTDARSALIRDRANLGRVLDAINVDPGEHDENKFVTANK